MNHPKFQDGPWLTIIHVISFICIEHFSHFDCLSLSDIYTSDPWDLHKTLSIKVIHLLFYLSTIRLLFIWGEFCNENEGRIITKFPIPIHISYKHIIYGSKYQWKWPKWTGGMFMIMWQEHCFSVQLWQSNKHKTLLLLLGSTFSGKTFYTNPFIIHSLLNWIINWN